VLSTLTDSGNIWASFYHSLSKFRDWIKYG